MTNKIALYALIGLLFAAVELIIGLFMIIMSVPMLFSQSFEGVIPIILLFLLFNLVIGKISIALVKLLVPKLLTRYMPLSVGLTAIALICICFALPSFSSSLGLTDYSQNQSLPLHVIVAELIAGALIFSAIGYADELDAKTSVKPKSVKS